MRASVIMPARNAERTIARALAALAHQDLPGGYEVIVVDDGSADRTRELAEQAEGLITVLSQPPSGPGAARNLGAAHARAPALAFCDADVFPTEGWLRSGLAALDHADLIQGRVLPDPEARLGPFDRTIWVTEQHGLWESANLFATRELFLSLGGFTRGIAPRRGKPLAEDVYFGYAASRLGARTAFAPDALAYHAVFPRRWPEYVTERTRLRYFPAMARAAPEMREAFLYRHVFLDHRSARLDLALSGVAAGALLRSPLPLAVTYPYLRLLHSASRRCRATGQRWWSVAAADLAGDLVGLGALTYGSVRERSLVL